MNQALEAKLSELSISYGSEITRKDFNKSKITSDKELQKLFRTLVRPNKRFI